MASDFGVQITSNINLSNEVRCCYYNRIKFTVKRQDPPGQRMTQREMIKRRGSFEIENVHGEPLTKLVNDLKGKTDPLTNQELAQIQLKLISLKNLVEAQYPAEVLGVSSRSLLTAKGQSGENSINKYTDLQVKNLLQKPGNSNTTAKSSMDDFKKIYDSLGGGSEHP